MVGGHFTTTDEVSEAFSGSKGRGCQCGQWEVPAVGDKMTSICTVCTEGRSHVQILWTEYKRLPGVCKVRIRKAGTQTETSLGRGTKGKKKSFCMCIRSKR